MHYFFKGKGMSSAERAALNAPRQSSMSSQMAAISAAAKSDDESSSPTSGGIKGKLDQIKLEPMDIKQEDLNQNDNQNEGGKGIKQEIKSEIKTEIKNEPMDENDTMIKEEIHIKEESHMPDSSQDVKPSITDNAIVPAGGAEKKQKCSKFSNKF